MKKAFFHYFHVIVITITILLYHSVFEGPTGSALVFDGLIFLTALILLVKFSFRIKKDLFPVFLIILIFLLVVTIKYFVIDGNQFGLKYYLQSVRYLVYMLAFVLFVSFAESFGENRIYQSSVSDLKSFYFVFVCLFLVFYSIQILILSEDRPRLYSENNFEIPSLLLITAALLATYKSSLLPIDKREKISVVSSLIVSVMSLSKSGAVESFAVIFNQLKKQKSPLLIMSGLVALTAFGILIAYVVISRLDSGQSIQDIDRFRFFNYFISDFGQGSLVQKLFGHGPADALPFGTCKALSFWSESLFDGFAYCNAVIYHSLFLRIIYEYGILTCILFILFWFFILKRAFGFNLGIILFAIITIASTSVSGFSNSIIIWPIFSMLFIKELRKENV